MIHFATIAQMQNANAYLHNQIEQAKLAQNAYHQQQMVSIQQERNNIDQQMLFLQQNKMENDKRMEAEKLSFEHYKFEQTMNAQREQNQSNIAVAEIGRDTELKKTLLQNEGNQTLAFMGMQGKMIEQHNNALQEMLMRMLDFHLGEQMAQNNHEREKELLELQERWKQKQINLQSRQEKERALFEHNAKILEQVIAKKLQDGSISFKDPLSYQKFSEFIEAMISEILGTEVQEYFDESGIGKAADKLARSVYSPY